ncbi:hypothetical protein L208DRAFT_1381500 [Tricholoma matsutake]|nr:hypothetical protein L208DRAFT_1381500 [Tricholoma matsutake 945]
MAAVQEHLLANGKSKGILCMTLFTTAGQFSSTQISSIRNSTVVNQIPANYYPYFQWPAAPVPSISSKTLCGDAGGLKLQVYMSLSNYDLKQPGLCNSCPELADVHLHTNTLSSQDQWWVCQNDGTWKNITVEYLAGANIPHPMSLKPVVLSKMGISGELTYVRVDTHKMMVNKMFKAAKAVSQ